MSGRVEKVDGALNAAYQAWAADPAVAPDAGISVNLIFQDDLGKIEALGFETHTVLGNQVMGVVRFKDIPALVAHSGVLWLAAGRPSKKDLNSAVRDIKARASAPISGAPVDGVWHADEKTGALTKVPKGTGAGVVVAILDSGIDVTHPMFHSQMTPAKKTRILRIWDQGLAPAAITDCPAVALLGSSRTYGVEIKKDKIDAQLAGGAKIPHKDCEGHGTHVAGIAVGGRLFDTDGNARNVGVAPEADIIVVKLLDLPEKIFFRNADATASVDPVEWGTRLRDAVLYSVRAARESAPNKAVVINLSFGDPGKPGDGLDPEARWFDLLLNPNTAAGPVNFPKGVVVVKSGGNFGDEENLRVARIRVPSTGEVIVPLKLSDRRSSGTNTDWKQCADQPHKPAIGVHFWYRRPAAPLSARFALRLPNGTLFGSDVMVGAKHELGFRMVMSTPPVASALPFGPTVLRFTIDHEDTAPVIVSSSVTVRRQHVYFFVEPKVSGPTVSYQPGIYEMRIRADPDTEIFALCEVESWNKEPVFFSVSETLQNGTGIDPTEIKMLEEFTSIDPLGEHVITVANYDDTNGNASKPHHHHISDGSSRGPLRNYSDPANPVSVFNKPDIAAPGENINSALSRDIKEGLDWHLPSWNDGNRFREFSGASMATPMVSGVIAIMLEKNPNLSTTEVRTKLAARAAVSPSAPPASTNAYGKGMVDALTSQANA